MFGDNNFVEDVYGRIGQTPWLTTDIDAIIGEACNLYQLSRKDLIASGKGRLASEARAVAAWVVREIPDLSLMKLSQCFKRDIATISISIERMLARTKINTTLRNNLKKIAKKFQIQ